MSVTNHVAPRSLASVASHRRRSGPFRLRNPLLVRDWRVRTKLAAVLIFPAIGFLIVTGLQTTSSFERARDAGTFADQVSFGRQVTALVHELQRERDHTAGILAAQSAPGATGLPAAGLQDLAPDRTAVDRAAAAFRDSAVPLLGGTPVREAYDSAVANLGELPRVRTGVQAGWLRERAAFDVYSRIIADLLSLLPQPSAVGGDEALGQRIRALADLAQAKELTAQIRGRLYAACYATRFGPGEFESLADIRAQRQAALARFRAEAAPNQIAYYDDTVTGQAVQNANRLEATASGSRVSTVDVDPEQWWAASTTQLELVRKAEANLLSDAVSSAGARSSAEWRSTILATLWVVFLLLGTLLISLVIGRRMANSLRTLREHAHDVAQARLPGVIQKLRAGPGAASALDVDPPSVRGSDEIGEVSDAFTAVHRSAVRLAVEQATMRHNVNAMFVNLARRSQALVERQLLLLDRLEAAETDPDQLDSLFRLDHLATRMRRNDENLLVLAGSDATRRWTEPVGLSSVVLAAVAEIEQFTRIRHDITDAVFVVGHAVADVVHLVAELLENATVFSPPDTTVSVFGWASPDGNAVLMIQDEGMGMSPETLSELNRKLSEPTSIDVASAERMGLVVVAHLAARHGIRVEIRRTSPGVAAYVLLPAVLLAEAPPGALELPPPARHSRALPAGPTTAEASRETEEPARRSVPTRAEDVLGAASRDTGSVWWSRTGAARKASIPQQRPRPTPEAAPVSPAPVSPAPVSPAPVSPAPVSPAPIPVSPVPAGTNGGGPAGLPVRVPMAQLPENQLKIAAPPPPKSADAEPDPTHVGSVLSRFYGGVHRAAAEDEEPHPSA